MLGMPVISVTTSGRRFLKGFYAKRLVRDLPCSDVKNVVVLFHFRLQFDSKIRMMIYRFKCFFLNSVLATSYALPTFTNT